VPARLLVAKPLEDIKKVVLAGIWGYLTGYTGGSTSATTLSWGHVRIQGSLLPMLSNIPILLRSRMGVECCFQFLAITGRT